MKRGWLSGVVCCGLVWPSLRHTHEERLKYLHLKRRLEILIYVAQIGSAVDIWTRLSLQREKVKRPGINIKHAIFYCFCFAFDLIISM